MNRSRAVPVARGDELPLTIEALGDGPDGIARVGDYVVFVPGVLPGERALVRITSATRKFARGALVAVQRTAPQRVPARCAHFLACGGCHRQHQAYGDQLADKQQRLQRALDHALGRDAPQVPAPLAGEPFGQRHKVVLHLRNGDAGLEACFHRLRSPELVPVHECPTSQPAAFRLARLAVHRLATLRHGAWDPDFAQDGLLRSVLVRTTTTGMAHVVVVARRRDVPGLERLLDDLHAAGATTIAVNGNAGEFSQLLGPETHVLSGPPRIEERLGGVRYLVSPDAFFQTSPHAAEHLVRLVTGWLAPTAQDDVADLYCGGGLLTLPLARTARSVVGTEWSRRALQDGEAAARANGLTNITWRQGPVDASLAACRRGALPRPHLVAVDPPRTGLDESTIAALGELAPRRIAYVSCDMQSLTRDLKALAAGGFVVRAVQPVDMFPQTAHLEAVAMLERRS